MKSFSVIRTHLSPYQASDFTSLEKIALEKIPGLHYTTLLDWQKGSDNILITNTHTKLSELPKEVLKYTKLILHPNSGYDHFAQEANIWEKIPLVVGHKIRAQAVAEYSIASLFQGLAELPQHIMWDAERRWNRQLIGDTSIMVFGYGHIGKIVADTVRALGAHVSVIDPYISECPHPLFKSWQDAKVVLKQSRAIIACLSLNPISNQLFNEDFFAHAHPELLFINGARGKLVDEESLKHFLKFHPQAFAFLDVFEKEPFSQEWHNHPQVWKSSHIAGVSKELDQKIIHFETQTLKDFQDLDFNEFSLKYKNELLQNKWIKGVLI